MPVEYGRAGALPPTAVADAVNVPVRTDSYGALIARHELTAWCEEGNYYKACNPTPGTGIAMGIQTTFSDTANVLLCMVNFSTVKIIPHYIRLICTAAGTTTTSSNIAIKLDTVNRYSSGGTDLLATAYNTRSDRTNAHALFALRFGAVTAAAVTAARLTSRAVLKTQAAPCWVVGDEVVLSFAGTEPGPGLLSGAAAGSTYKQCGPVILGLGHSMLIHMWNPANATTPPSWEVEVGWWQR